LRVVVIDRCRRVNRDVTVTTDENSSAAGPDGDLSSSADTAPKLDLAFKEGETIKINITVSTAGFFCLLIAMLLLRFLVNRPDYILQSAYVLMPENIN